MGRDVEYSQIEATLRGLAYPIARSAAASQLTDVTLLLADGEANLGKLIDAAASHEFVSPNDVISGLHNTAPSSRGALPIRRGQLIGPRSNWSLGGDESTRIAIVDQYHRI